MKKVNVNNLYESHYPPEDINTLWVDKDETTGKIRAIHKYNKAEGKWEPDMVSVDYMKPEGIEADDRFTVEYGDLVHLKSEEVEVLEVYQKNGQPSLSFIVLDIKLPVAADKWYYTQSKGTTYIRGYRDGGAPYNNNDATFIYMLKLDPSTSIQTDNLYNLYILGKGGTAYESLLKEPIQKMANPFEDVSFTFDLKFELK